MEGAVVKAALWVVELVLGPAKDALLKAWAASNDLGTNFKALENELLAAQAVLSDISGREIDNAPLAELLWKLQDHAYGAGDLLDELDYFRIDDVLHGTSEATDKRHVRGCAHDIALHSRHAVMSVVRAAGKCLTCSSPPPADDLRRAAGMHGGAATIHTARREGNTPKNLAFNRADVSQRMSDITNQLQNTRKTVILATICSKPATPCTDLSITHSRPMTTHEIIEDTLYGRRVGELDSIVSDITQGRYSDNKLTILPIVGPGGIGKTILAQHIYGNKQVKEHFRVRVWIYVPFSFDVHELMKEILSRIDKDGYETKGTTGELIAQRVKSRRFLLILDGMWNYGCEDDWERLLSPFKKSQEKGNIIIVTTRLQKILETLRISTEPIHLESLDHQSLKELLLAYAFGDEKPTEQEDKMLLEVADKIIVKLWGSPLAAKTVGRLLGNNRNYDHWRKVLKSRAWESKDGKGDLMPVLKLSYDFLPSYLQQCFSFCALFPQGYKFDSEELIHFWIGLDILRPHNQHISNIPEDIGQTNLNELVSHGFLIRDETYGFSRYLKQHLFHELASKVASRECLSVHRSNVQSIQAQPSIRHLSIIIDKVDDSDGMTDEIFKRHLVDLISSLRVGNLQSLMIFGALDESFANIFGDLFMEANRLRLLCLPRMSCSVESILHNFSALLHVRYLRLGTMSRTELPLPCAISRFYHMKILDLQSWNNCYCFPRNMTNLTKLRHFLTKSDEVHSDISRVGKLQLLQELKIFQVHKEKKGFELEELGSLIQLRELGIHSLENIGTNEKATEAKLLEKTLLEKLTLAWKSNRSNSEIDPSMEASVLESLKPHENLRHLWIREHRGPSCPTWLGDKHSGANLHTLHLHGVAWVDLPYLGQMPMLHELTLEDMPMLKGSGLEFPGTLKIIKIIGLKELEWVLKEAPRDIKHLQLLIIKDCPKLLGLSFDPLKQLEEWYIYWFPQLQRLQINNCPNFETLPFTPWTQTLFFVEIRNVGSKRVDSLFYSKSPSWVSLEITGKDSLCSLHDVLYLSNLSDLQGLTMINCPFLSSEDLKALTSLKRLQLRQLLNTPADELYAKGQLQTSLEHLSVEHNMSGKELSRLLSHFPMLSGLDIQLGRKISRFGIEEAASAIHSAQRRVQWLLAAAAVWLLPASCSWPSEVQPNDVLLFPSSYFDSLQQLCIRYSSVVLNLDEANSRGGLQWLPSLKKLVIQNYPMLFSAYKKSSSSSPFYPFPPSLQDLTLDHVEGMTTLNLLSNLMSLAELHIDDCGESLTAEGLWPLITQGKLTYLEVYSCPKFFDYCPDPTAEVQGQDQKQLRGSRSKLRELVTDAGTGALFGVLCHASLTELEFHGANSFTAEQEEALQRLTSLRELRFHKCFKLKCLPASLHKLTGLKRLQIYNCHLITSLPKGGLPVSLQELYVSSERDIKDLQKECRNYIRDHPQIMLLL